MGGCVPLPFCAWGRLYIHTTVTEDKTDEKDKNSMYIRSCMCERKDS